MKQLGKLVSYEIASFVSLFLCHLCHGPVLPLMCFSPRGKSWRRCWLGSPGAHTGWPVGWALAALPFAGAQMCLTSSQHNNFHKTLNRQTVMDLRLRALWRFGLELAKDSVRYEKTEWEGIGQTLCSHVTFSSEILLVISWEAQKILLGCRTCLTKTPTELALLNLSKWTLRGNTVSE